MSSNKQRIFILITTGTTLVVVASVAGFAPLSFEKWQWFVLLSATVCGLPVYASVWVWRNTVPSGVLLWIALACGIVIRLLCTGSEHMLSDDIARYHFDGKQIVHGKNPYEYSPHTIQLLISMRIDSSFFNLPKDALDKQVNTSHVRTPYPPLAELLFAVAYLLSPGDIIGFQILFILAEIVTWFLLWWYIDIQCLPRAHLLIAIWLPLVSMGGYLPGHVDILGLPFMAAFLISTRQGWPIRTGLSLAAVCMIKPIGLFFLPAALRELGPKRSVVMVLSAVAMIVVFYIPVIWTGRSHFYPMLQMTVGWKYNPTIAAVLDAMLPAFIARGVNTLLLGSLVLIGAWWGKDFFTRCLLAMAAFLAVSPVVFPWYLMWLIPLVVLRPDPSILIVLLLIPLTGIVGIDWNLKGQWGKSVWPIAVAFTPFYVSLIICAWRRWGMFAKEPHDSPTDLDREGANTAP